jgi:hypothetical protein
MAELRSGADPALDEELDEALADRVVAAGRRRQRQRWAVAAAVTLAIGAAVAIPGLVASGEHTGGTVAQRGGPAVDPAGGASGPAVDPAGPGVSVQAQIYAAALTNDGGPRARLLVRDHICTSVPRAPADCDSGPIPVAVQREVTALAGGHIHFVRNARAPEGNGEPALIVFGDLVVTGSRATLGMETLCGPLCGQGQTFVLAERQGQWRVTGMTGPSWIN